MAGTAFFRALSASLAAVGMLYAAAAAEDAARPNIVLVLADDLGVNDLGCYGRQEHKTPHLDRLAAEGLRCTAAYAAAPVCSPSRAGLLTGKHPARLNLTAYLPGRPDCPAQRVLQPVIEGRLPLEERTLAEVLRTAGYATGCFGKWHLGDGEFGPQGQGFDVAAAPASEPADSATSGGKGELLIAEAAEKFLTEHRDQPFFCYLPHNAPHIPLAADQLRIERFSHTFNPTYAAMIETLDESVGRVLAKLEELHLTQRTIVIFASDNGGLHVLEGAGTPATHNTPCRAGKGFIYEGGLRIPLIVRWPGQIPAGTLDNAPVTLLDLFPTLLDAAGLSAAQTVGPVDGDSQWSRWRTGQAAAERTLYWHSPHYTNQGGRPAGSIRQGADKLIENYEDGSLELYRLSADAGETTNLAATEPARAAALQQQLQAWRLRINARIPAPNPQWDAAVHRRLYVDPDPSRLLLKSTAAETAANWREWRQGLNGAVAGRKPRLTAARGDVRLLASAATVHAKTMRYEPEPYKDVLGYWVDAADWAEWAFEPPAAGLYEVEIQQGCGAGSGGAEVAVEVAGQTLKFVVVDTGHFQNMQTQVIGEVPLPAGRQTLSVKPLSKPGAAVMDLRRVVLRPRTREIAP